MKLLKREISAKDGEGRVTLIPEETEDLWHLYNLLLIGDRITASTIRKVVSENATSVSAQRKRITLTIKVTAIDFDPQDGGCIRLAGQNVEPNAHIKLGAFHTIEIGPNRKISIYKDSWDTIILERLDEACDPTAKASVGAVVMQQGLAHVCLITDSMTIIRAKIEQSIPRKRGDASNHRKAMDKFFDKVMQSLLRHVDLKEGKIKVVIIAGPGYIKDDFFKFMMEQAQRQENKLVLKNKGIFLLCHASSGFKHALDQVLQDPAIQAKLADTKAFKETEALNKFFRMLNNDSDRAYYSYSHVIKAQEKGAIKTLLLTDSLFRANDIKTRAKYVKLVEECREAGVEVHIFSSLHVSGKQLEQMSGVAAILRFPLPEIEEEQMVEADFTVNTEKEKRVAEDMDELTQSIADDMSLGT